MNKTKVIISGEWQKVMQKAVRWLCGICNRGIGNNSIQCTSCQKWVHRKRSGIKGSIYKVMKTFVCTGCMNPVTNKGCTTTLLLLLLHSFNGLFFQDSLGKPAAEKQNQW